MAKIKPSLEPSTDERSPLRKFTGVLQDYTALEETSNAGKKYTLVHFNFEDIDVPEGGSVEPYNFKTAQIDVFYSERPDSDWDVFKKSAVDILPMRDIDLLIGKKQTWEMVAARTNKPDPNGGGQWFMQDSLNWTVVSVEGMAGAVAEGPSLEDEIIAIVNGRSEPDFLQEFYEATHLRDLEGYEETAELISNRDYLPALSEAGKIIQDADGVWAKV